MNRQKLMNNLNKIHELLLKVLDEYRTAGLDYDTYISYVGICDDSLELLDYETLLNVYKDLDSCQSTFLSVMNIDRIPYYLKQIRMLLLEMNSSDDEERIRERDYPRNYDYDLER